VAGGARFQATTPPGCAPKAAWAHLCAAPIPASSGKVARHRLNRGGDRQANHALWRIVITRMGSHPPTRAYIARLTLIHEEGRTCRSLRVLTDERG
jgi:Transposase IS116/IS110/IS902 family